MSSKTPAESPPSDVVKKSTISKEGEASKNVQSAAAGPPQKKRLLSQPNDENDAKKFIAGELSPADNLQVVRSSRKRKRASDRSLLDAVRQQLDFGEDLSGDDQNEL